ncbi:MAG TPA: hypothetical protein VF902_02575 [Coriobacteriia bacterium]
MPQRKDRGKLAATATVALIASPVVASALGLLVGVSALLLTRRGARFLTPETLELGAARAVAFMCLGMFAAFFSLMGYYLWARDGLSYFGIGLVIGFMVPATLALFSAAGLTRPATPRR